MLPIVGHRRFRSSPTSTPIRRSAPACVKITPAHDANDFEVGRRHALPMPVVIDEHGSVREVADADGRVPAELAGLDRFDARERIVEMLRDERRAA